ncbi:MULTISPECIES: hypothetical protein [Myxococcus]|uniref:hypothetical protein n=1 Tax=Myxococcus TaxID=32 RepID=UPI001143C9DF|nr:MULTISPECIES: hypothetical protein [Myxococcus]NOJ53025.1 hypothetical protein [Myxococcus xanthus]QPM80135.1 hypothetical protein I5Q59_02220 [Myxococcus xanthus]QVW69199.1 hypothetical protein JTM82_06510 [Myxococcus xanthus DZ2]UEO04673.1 hypothetical protein K1515_36300 [Myxococcus xanthus DZ2]UYI15114.1 hypothetical protein N3T43_02125 [Myxococcus xanthus]
MRQLSYILMLVLMSFGATASASDDVDESLRYLPGVAIVVQSLPPHASITTAQVRTMTELALRRSGIRIFTDDEAISVSGYPVLHVNIDIGKPKEAVIYSVDITLRQFVRLLSTKSLARAITWTTSGGYGVVPRHDVGSLIREGLQPMLDDFCNDYLKANPPQHRPARVRPAVMDLVDPEPVVTE